MLDQVYLLGRPGLQGLDASEREQRCSREKNKGNSGVTTEKEAICAREPN